MAESVNWLNCLKEAQRRHQQIPINSAFMDTIAEELELLNTYRSIGTVEDFQRLKDEACGAYPTTDLSIKPKCFYQETNHNRFCGALGRGENDDEPIGACQKCVHCEFNTLSEEADHENN